MKDERTERLGTVPIIKLLKELSIPATLGMVLNATYNVVDGIFIGRVVGREALAGVTVAFPLMMISFAIIIMVSSGASAMFSIYLGRRDEEMARYCVGNAYTSLAVVLGLFTGVVFLFKMPVLRLFGGRGDVLMYAFQYVRIALPFNIVLGYQVLWENMTRAEGNARVALYSIGMTSMLNILLDYLFISVFGWGVTGAASATAISQVIGTSYLAYYVYRYSPRLMVARKYFKMRFDVLKEMYGLGFSSFTRQTTFSLQALILNNVVVSYGGDLGLAIVGIISRLFTFLALPVLGMVQGMRPILSYNYGAKQYDRAKKTIRYAIIGGSGFLVFGFLVSQFFSVQVVSIFTTEPELIAEGARVLRIATLVFPIISIQIVGSASFQSLKRPWLAFIFSVLRQILLFIPLLIILPRYLGFDGIWWTYPISDVLAMVITLIVLKRELNKLPEEADVA